jgi:hypothetical protein
MKQTVVDIIRRFTAIVGLEGAWDFLHPISGKAVRWNELEDQRRVLILADPGAGKTFEARDRADRLRRRGRQAFFIRIEAIDGEFDHGFEVGTAAEFAAWLASTDEGWFFLDSVDEAQLDTPRALETAVRTFGARIHDARERTHIFITSREDAWQALPDRTLIEQYLPYGVPPESDKPERVNDKAVGDKDVVQADAEEKDRPALLKVYRLNGLKEDEIALFAAHHGVGDTTPFLDAIKRANLMNLAERPFDLKALLAKWQNDHKLGSRFEVLQRVIALQIAPLGARGTNPSLPADRVRAAVRTLAGAVLMTGRTKVCLPNGLRAPDRIDPCILLPDWSEAEIEAVLRCGLFDDVVYTSVRFRHREIRELLAAEWAHGLLNQPGARPTVEGLFFRDSYGTPIIVPRTRPILPWLILLDEQVRDRALALAPDIASEGGDPSQLPLDVRRTMLKDVTEQIVREKE